METLTLETDHHPSNAGILEAAEDPITYEELPKLYENGTLIADRQYQVVFDRYECGPQKKIKTLAYLTSSIAKWVFSTQGQNTNDQWPIRREKKINDSKLKEIFVKMFIYNNINRTDKITINTESSVYKRISDHFRSNDTKLSSLVSKYAPGNINQQEIITSIQTNPAQSTISNPQYQRTGEQRGLDVIGASILDSIQTLFHNLFLEQIVSWTAQVVNLVNIHQQLYRITIDQHYERLVEYIVSNIPENIRNEVKNRFLQNDMRNYLSDPNRSGHELIILLQSFASDHNLNIEPIRLFIDHMNTSQPFETTTPQPFETQPINDLAHPITSISNVSGSLWGVIRMSIIKGITHYFNEGQANRQILTDFGINNTENLDLARIRLTDVTMYTTQYGRNILSFYISPSQSRTGPHIFISTHVYNNQATLLYAIREWSIPRETTITIRSYLYSEAGMILRMYIRNMVVRSPAPPSTVTAPPRGQRPGPRRGGSTKKKSKSIK